MKRALLSCALTALLLPACATDKNAGRREASSPRGGSAIPNEGSSPGGDAGAAPSRRAPAPRVPVETAPGQRPAWIEKGVFRDPSTPGYRFFTGFSSGRKSKSEAREAALADARGQAAEYMATRVESVFDKKVSSLIERNRESYRERIESDTRTEAVALLEGSEPTGAPYWIRYSDGTFEYHVLIRVPEKNLDPVRALVRSLRRAGALSKDPAERAAFMEGILALLPGDRLALYTKARALETSGRPGDALFALEELKRLNRDPSLDLAALAREGGVAPPAGAPSSIDLDGLVFELTPHWENALEKIRALAENRENRSVFAARLNAGVFRRSDFGPREKPVQARFTRPAGKPWHYLLFWIDGEGIFQANAKTPRPDRVPDIGAIRMPLGTTNGKVTLLFLAAADPKALDLGGLDLDGFRGKGILKEKIAGKKDRAELNRLEAFLSRLEEMTRAGGKVFVSAASFTQEP